MRGAFRSVHSPCNGHYQINSRLNQGVKISVGGKRAAFYSLFTLHKVHISVLKKYCPRAYTSGMLVPRCNTSAKPAPASGANRLPNYSDRVLQRTIPFHV
jgi:hypothetical protein